MNANLKLKTPEDPKASFRRAALAAADRSIDLEGLPKADAFARSFDEDLIAGRRTPAEVAAELVKHYRVAR